MEAPEALAILRGILSVKRTLAAAPRRGKLARSVGERLRLEADAIGVAIDALERS